MRWAIGCGALVALSGELASGLKKGDKNVSFMGASPDELAGVGEGTDNPFASGEAHDWIVRWDATARHGAGIIVDLMGQKTVDNKAYREPAGKCPVYGKMIVLEQPAGDPYTNNFLSPVPTQAEADGHLPMPGGFASNFVSGSVSLSPVTMEFLEERLYDISNPLYACARFAYHTTALASDGSETQYRYPFVWDTQEELCYVLFVTMQWMQGDTYCSVNGKPADKAWYCFHPEKDPETRYIYGSGYVAEDEGASQKGCISRGVKDGLPGIWTDGVCVVFEADDDYTSNVSTKEDCYLKAFELSASDNPSSYSSTETGGSTFWPRSDPGTNTQGIGYNIAMAVANESGTGFSCRITNEVPDCFEWAKGSYTYHALGGHQVECAPARLETNGDTRTSQLVSGWDKDVTKGGPCGNEFDVALFFAIAGGVLAGLLLIGAGAWAYRRHKQRARASTQWEQGEYDPDDEAAEGAAKPGPDDVVAEAEASFWGVSGSTDQQGSVVVVEE